MQQYSTHKTVRHVKVINELSDRLQSTFLLSVICVSSLLGLFVHLLVVCSSCRIDDD
jgi:hypothetical protein